MFGAQRHSALPPIPQQHSALALPPLHNGIPPYRYLSANPQKYPPLVALTFLCSQLSSRNLTAQGCRSARLTAMSGKLPCLGCVAWVASLLEDWMSCSSE